jgi:hypothetical protein
VTTAERHALHMQQDLAAADDRLRSSPVVMLAAVPASIERDVLSAAATSPAHGIGMDVLARQAARIDAAILSTIPSDAAGTDDALLAEAAAAADRMLEVVGQYRHTLQMLVDQHAGSPTALRLLSGVVSLSSQAGHSAAAAADSAHAASLVESTLSALQLSFADASAVGVGESADSVGARVLDWAVEAADVCASLLLLASKQLHTGYTPEAAAALVDAACRVCDMHDDAKHKFVLSGLDASAVAVYGCCTGTMRMVRSCRDCLSEAQTWRDVAAGPATAGGDVAARLHGMRAQWLTKHDPANSQREIAAAYHLALLLVRRAASCEASDAAVFARYLQDALHLLATCQPAVIRQHGLLKQAGGCATAAASGPKNPPKLRRVFSFSSTASSQVPGSATLDAGGRSRPSWAAPCMTPASHRVRARLAGVQEELSVPTITAAASVPRPSDGTAAADSRRHTTPPKGLSLWRPPSSAALRNLAASPLAGAGAALRSPGAPKTPGTMRGHTSPGARSSATRTVAVTVSPAQRAMQQHMLERQQLLHRAQRSAQLATMAAAAFRRYAALTVLEAPDVAAVNNLSSVCFLKMHRFAEAVHVWMTPASQSPLSAQGWAGAVPVPEAAWRVLARFGSPLSDALDAASCSQCGGAAAWRTTLRKGCKEAASATVCIHFADVVASVSRAARFVPALRDADRQCCGSFVLRAAYDVMDATLSLCLGFPELQVAANSALRAYPDLEAAVRCVASDAAGDFVPLRMCLALSGEAALLLGDDVAAACDAPLSEDALSWYGRALVAFCALHSSGHADVRVWMACERYVRAALASNRPRAALWGAGMGLAALIRTPGCGSVAVEVPRAAVRFLDSCCLWKAAVDSSVVPSPHLQLHVDADALLRHVGRVPDLRPLPEAGDGQLKTPFRRRDEWEIARSGASRSTNGVEAWSPLDGSRLVTGAGAHPGARRTGIFDTPLTKAAASQFASLPVGSSLGAPTPHHEAPSGDSGRVPTAVFEGGSPGLVFLPRSPASAAHTASARSRDGELVGRPAAPRTPTADSMTPALPPELDTNDGEPEADQLWSPAAASLAALSDLRSPGAAPAAGEAPSAEAEAACLSEAGGACERPLSSVDRACAEDHARELLQPQPITAAAAIYFMHASLCEATAQALMLSGLHAAACAHASTERTVEECLRSAAESARLQGAPVGFPPDIRTAGCFSPAVVVLVPCELSALKERAARVAMRGDPLAAVHGCALAAHVGRAPPDEPAECAASIHTAAPVACSALPLRIIPHFGADVGPGELAPELGVEAASPRLLLPTAFRAIPTSLELQISAPLQDWLLSLSCLQGCAALLRAASTLRATQQTFDTLSSPAVSPAMPLVSYPHHRSGVQQTPSRSPLRHAAAAARGVASLRSPHRDGIGAGSFRQTTAGSASPERMHRKALDASARRATELRSDLDSAIRDISRLCTPRPCVRRLAGPGPGEATTPLHDASACVLKRLQALRAHLF